MKFSIENILRKDRKDLTSHTNACSQGLESVQRKSGGDVNARSSSPESSSSCCSDDISHDVSHRRPRTAITTWQRDRLEALFDGQRYPAAERIEVISEQLGLPQHVIKVWFQNRRAKLRKEGVKRRKPMSLTATSTTRPQLHHLATVMQAAEYPRQINDKEIELVHSRATPGQSGRLRASPDVPGSCPCCPPPLQQGGFVKPGHHELPCPSLPYFREQHIGKPFSSFVYPLPYHRAAAPLVNENAINCCCVRCRAGTYYAKY